MPILGPLAIAVPLFLLAVGLLAHHVSSWKRLRKRDDLSRRDRRFFRRQLLRRMQASALMALLSVGLVVGVVFVSHRQSPRLFVGFWFALLLLGIWMGLLALVDLWSIASYGRQKRRELFQERFRRGQGDDAHLKPHEGNGRKRATRSSSP